MSERQFKLTVVSPDRDLVVDLPVTAVGARGTEGDFTALPGHAPFLTDLRPALMWYRGPDQVRQEIFVGGGFVEVLPGKVTILADSCERPGEIDIERAERARARAELKLKQAREKAAKGLGAAADPAAAQEISAEAQAELRKAEIKLRRAVARINAVKKSRLGGR
jgi:F-type H+-transporting ATPase subunit epsilon